MNKLQLFQNFYLKHKTSLLPSALWKATNNIDMLRIAIIKKPFSLKLLSNDKLYIFYDESNNPQKYFKFNARYFNLILLNQKYFDSNIFSKKHARFFKLSHQLKSIQKVNINDNFEIRKASFTQASLISKFIRQCYPDLKPTPKSVLSWADHPTYNKNLWIWLWDKKANQPAALAISEIDNSISEGALEWIQVHPDYQGFGLGKTIVNISLHELSKKASFVTVGGKNPIALNLYKSCGFNNISWFYVIS